MLASLRLHNIALIENLELFFENGLTVLTGETGAGKSLLMDALDLLLGGVHITNASRYLRIDSKKAYIEARFLRSKSIEDWLTENSFESDDEDLVISREWNIKEQRISSRFRFNGLVVNRDQILALRPFLINLTSQGQKEDLSSPKYYIRCLDKFGTSSLKDVLNKAKKAWYNWSKANIVLKNALLDLESKQEKIEFLKNLLIELEGLDLEDPNEIETLKAEEDRLLNGVALQEGLQKLLFSLREGDLPSQTPSALDHLHDAIHHIQQMIKYDSSLTSCLDKLLEGQQLFHGILLDLDSYSALLDSDPARLSEVQDRLASLKGLERRNGKSIPELISLRNDLRDSLTTDSSHDSLKQMQLNEKTTRKNRDDINSILSGLRKEVATDMENRLMEYLRPLALSNVQFQIDVQDCPPSESGQDEVTFLFSANAGQPLAPLVSVASGGEMSRFLLALKTLLSQVNGTPTLLFDEIDAGVSGRVSDAIACVLRDLSRKHQVFCITHQPLIAAAADHHFAVVKSVEKEITRTDVLHLRDLQERKCELAELAGGDFDQAIAFASSLLEDKAA